MSKDENPAALVKMMKKSLGKKGLENAKAVAKALGISIPKIKKAESRSDEK